MLVAHLQQKKSCLKYLFAHVNAMDVPVYTNIYD